jgi:hypothetical protein
MNHIRRLKMSSLKKTSKQLKKEFMFLSSKDEKRILKDCGKHIGNEIYALLRELDKTTYAYHCNLCGGSWKVYQSAYHHKECPNNKETQNGKEEKRNKEAGSNKSRSSSQG